LLNKDLITCKKLINDQLKEIKSNEKLSIHPDLRQFALLILLHPKAILNRLKAFKEITENEKTTKDPNKLPKRQDFVKGID
jgi:hypothetical protein